MIDLREVDARLRRGDQIRARLTDGDLVEEGMVVKVDFEEDMLYIEVELPNGQTDLLDLDPAEPGLELIEGGVEKNA